MKLPWLGAGKPKRRAHGLHVYANLSAHRKVRRDAKSRARAEYLASLPKQPLKRLLYRLHPKRVLAYWFSRRGALMALKIAGGLIVVFALMLGGLFIYLRPELAMLNANDIDKRVQSTATHYYDRNGELLWEDRGTGDYMIRVKSEQIADYMKQATVAIEDKDFYKNNGISLTGIVRAGLNNVFSSGSTQGASTLTQQLVKNIFFFDEAAANRLDVLRKVKEIFLAIEVDRMYTKDQLLTLYLNKVSYGGRRNGVESAAQTYFGKPAKDLSLAEAAMIAAIPQRPSYYNPYNIEGNKALIARQHTVLDNMADQGYITAQQAKEAKAISILDTIKPELAATENIKAPHFVLSVRQALERQFGEQLVRAGGLHIKTTLDWRLQQIAENAVSTACQKFINAGRAAGADNMAFASIDVQTGQIMAEIGSCDYGNKNFGATNAARSLLQPGSSIKFADYASLFNIRTGQTFGAGSILSDENIDNIYKGKLQNFDNRFYGNLTAREAFSQSRNPPAVKAAYISGIDNVINLARDMGDSSYCRDVDYGLSAAIGACYVRLIEHVNAYATLANAGVTNKLSDVLEVKNAQGQVLQEWKSESKQVLDSQIAYLISDILTDPISRARVFGSNPLGFNVSGVKTATKTGTTDNGQGKQKDSWMMDYSTRLASGVWLGRHDGSALTGFPDGVAGTALGMYMSKAHTEVLQKDGKWKSGDWFQQPAGIQKLTINGKTDIYPAWFQKPKDAEGVKMMFDKVSKRKATDCTPDAAKVEVTVQVIEDPVTKKKNYMAPDGYDPNADDDRHKCDDVKPFVSLSTDSRGGGKYMITAIVNKGTFDLTQLEISVDGQVISSQPVGSPGTFSTEYTFTSNGDKTISAIITDQGYYTATVTKTVEVSKTGGSGQQGYQPRFGDGHPLLP